MAKAACWAVTDAEARKPGERTGLDTLVVPAVNDGARCGEAPPLRAAANALSAPPGEYGRKAKTQGIDGGPHKQRSMWLNSKQREEPYQA